ncbi:DUF937 domain-containing protein [Aliiroseovarius crassostreae]|uniref:DUF937 domain-containing protein n=1 Tax=Aliiroseovarius crassostreae TaxID=154981 RepID=UPI003C7A5544
MSLLQLLQQAQGGRGLKTLAEQAGIDPSKADELTAVLAPVIGRATKAQAEGGGLSGIVGALQGLDQARNYDQPDHALSETGLAQGQNFLNGILGAEGANRLTEQAAERTGIDASQVATFLPALAAMAQGGLQKTMPDDALSAMLPSSGGASGVMDLLGGLLNSGSSDSSNGGLGMLTAFLDADGDGSIADDILEKIRS